MSDVSTLFELLTAKPRRRVLVALCDVDSVRIPEGLTRRSAARSTSSPASRSPDEHSTDEVSRDDLQMYHNHLPKLQAAGVIEWDRDGGTVTRGTEFDAIEPAVRLFATNQHVLPGAFF